MSKAMRIAASTTWGPERKHFAAVVAAVIATVWALSFAGPAHARVILDDTSARTARNYDLSSLQASIRADGWQGDHAATLRMLTNPNYGDPQPERDGTPVETHTVVIDDGVDPRLLAAVTAGVVGVALLASMMARRRAVLPA